MSLDIKTIEKQLLNSATIARGIQKELIKNFKLEDFRYQESREIFKFLQEYEAKDSHGEFDLLLAKNQNLALYISTANNHGRYKEYMSMFKEYISKNVVAKKLTKAIYELKQKSAVETIDSLRLEEIRKRIIQEAPLTKTQKMIEVYNDIDLLYNKELRNKFIKTGISQLDDNLCHVRGGELMVVTGEPATGKTMLALNIYANNIKAGRNCIFVSLEMNFESIIYRLASMLYGVNPLFTRGGFTSENAIQKEAETFINFSTWFAECKNGEIISSKDLRNNSVNEILSYCEYIKETSGWDKIDMVIIDYLQYVDKNHEKQTEYEALEDNTRSFKTIAQKLDTALVLISSLNQTGELKGSSIIKYTADLIIKLIKKDNKIMLALVKNRFGMNPVFEIKYDKYLKLIEVTG